MGAIVYLFIMLQNSQRESAFMECSRLCGRKQTETMQQFLGGITIMRALRQTIRLDNLSVSEFEKINYELIGKSDWNISALTQLKYFANTTTMYAYVTPRNITRRPLNTRYPITVDEFLLIINAFPNESSIGMDYYSDYNRFTLVQKGKYYKDLVISDPIDTTTTGKVIIFFLPSYDRTGDFIGGISGAYREEVVVVDRRESDKLAYKISVNGKTFFTDPGFNDSTLVVSSPFQLDTAAFVFSCGMVYTAAITPVIVLIFGTILALAIPVVTVYSMAQIKRIETTTNEKMQIETEMTSAKINEQSAIQSAAVRSAFLANVSHEIRTPLNGISGMSQFLMDTDLSPEQRKYVNVIIRSSGMLMSIVNDVLDFSKAESENLIKEDIACNITAILHEIPDIYSNKSTKNNNTVEIQHDFTELWCLTDPSRLQQILTNLFSNATKFTKNGIVTLKAVAEPERIVFSVSDTGIGISPDQLPKLFTPFTQADATTTRKYGGTGLGLSICKKLVELLGGEIWVQSEIGKGSTFSFSIPFIPAKEPKAVPVSNDYVDDYKSFSKGKYVLVCDDNKINLRVAEKMLTNLGYSVLCANDGNEAVNLVSSTESRFSVVLMDIQMPVMDGYTATKLIRDSGNTIPIVSMTANVLSGEREKCIASGMQSYLSKPLNQKEMARVLREVITDLYSK